MNKFVNQTLFILAIILIALIVAFGVTSPTKAQGMRCTAYSIIEDKLTGPQYSEVKIATGLSGGRQTVLFVNPDTGKFTLIVRLPNHVGCVLGAGSDWKFHKIPERAKPGQDS